MARPQLQHYDESFGQHRHAVFARLVWFLPKQRKCGIGREQTLRQMTLISEPVWRQRQDPSASSAHTSSGFSFPS